MDRVEVSLEEALQLLVDGKLPKHGDPTFQSVAKRMREAEAQGLVEGSKFIPTSRRRGSLYGVELPFEPGRITPTGEEHLVRERARRRNTVREMVDDFCDSHASQWQHRYEEEQRRVQSDMSARGTWFSSIRFRELSNTYSDEGKQRIKEIKNFLTSYIDRASPAVREDHAVKVFTEAAKRAVSGFRSPLEQDVRNLGLTSQRMIYSHFDWADDQISAAIKAVQSDVRNHVASVSTRKAKEASASKIPAESKPIAQAQTLAKRLWSSLRSAFQWTIVKVIAAIIVVIVGLVGTKLLAPWVDQLFEPKAPTEVGGAEAPPSRSTNDE